MPYVYSYHFWFFLVVFVIFCSFALGGLAGCLAGELEILPEGDKQRVFLFLRLNKGPLAVDPHSHSRTKGRIGRCNQYAGWGFLA